MELWKTLAPLETFKLVSRASPIDFHKTLAPLEIFGFGSGLGLSIFCFFFFSRCLGFASVLIQLFYFFVLFG